MDQEIWRTVNVITYEGVKFVFNDYEVSNKGIVRSLGRFINNRHNTKTYCEGKVLKPDTTFNGYKRVTLYNENGRFRFSVHRIVASTFPEICGEWYEGAVVNHKDETTFNNVASNLEWCSIQYNCAYNHHMEGVNRNRSGSKPIIQLTLNGDFVKRYPSIKEAERAGITSKQNIMRVLKNKNGKMFQAGGFRWIYESGY